MLGFELIKLFRGSMASINCTLNVRDLFGVFLGPPRFSECLLMMIVSMLLGVKGATYIYNDIKLIKNFLLPSAHYD